MFRFFADAGATVERLFMHVCGDFGAAGMPGTFHIFFSEVVVGMARSELILTLPMAIRVDDCGFIGRQQSVSHDTHPVLFLVVSPCRVDVHIDNL